MAHGRHGRGVLSRDWEAKLGWFFGPGQSAHLRSSHGAMVRRLESRDCRLDSPEIRLSRRAFRAEIKEAEKDGRSRSSMPWEPLITAAPMAERPPPPAVVEFTSRSNKSGPETIAEVSSGLRRLAQVCPEGPAVLELLYDDAAEDWMSMGFQYGPLYRLDERAIRLVDSLRTAWRDRTHKMRDKAIRLKAVFAQPKRPSDLKLFVDDFAVATQFDDVDRLREYAALETQAHLVATRIAGVWEQLQRPKC